MQDTFFTTHFSGGKNSGLNALVSQTAAVSSADDFRVEYKKPNVQLDFVKIVQLPQEFCGEHFRIGSITPSLDGSELFVVVNKVATNSNPQPTSAILSYTVLQNTVRKIIGKPIMIQCFSLHVFFTLWHLSYRFERKPWKRDSFDHRFIDKADDSVAKYYKRNQMSDSCLVRKWSFTWYWCEIWQYCYNLWKWTLRRKNRLDCSHSRLHIIYIIFSVVI